MPTGKPKPQKRTQKIVATALALVLDSILSSAELREAERPVEIESSNEDTMILAEKIMLITEIGSKVYKLSTYKKAISDYVHSRQ